MSKPSAFRPIEIGPITLDRHSRRRSGTTAGGMTPCASRCTATATTIDTYEAVRIVQALSDWLQAATGVRP